MRINVHAGKVHKITTRKLETEGCDTLVELGGVYRIFNALKRRAKRIVAHNAAFDCRIMKQTAEQHGFERWNITKLDVFCTMQSSKARCGLVSEKNQKPKAPSNSQLYEHLFLSKPSGSLHDAVVDLKVTAASYVEGCRRGWWTENDNAQNPSAK